MDDICPKCGMTISKTIEVPKFDGTDKKRTVKVHVMCECEIKEKEELEIKEKIDAFQSELKELSKFGILDIKQQEATFENWKITDKNSKNFEIVKRYIQKFDELFESGQGLLLWGDVGTGKSYAAYAIANELIKKMRLVLVTSFVKLLEDTKGFGSNGQYIKSINRAELLIIDDLGAERGTEYALEKVYDIIDSRYRSGKPIILTTNLTMVEMKNCTETRYKRIYDRIFEMCYPIKFDGISWRKKCAVERFDKTKRILEEQ